MKKKWNNLKNSWEEYDRVEGWFQRSKIDDKIAFFMGLMILYIAIDIYTTVDFFSR